VTVGRKGGCRGAAKKKHPEESERKFLVAIPKRKKQSNHQPTRRPIRTSLRQRLLLEAGYRCSNPVCRNVIALDIHHLVRVAEGGADTEDNLIALCPNCHALHHRGVIPGDALRTWKVLLVALNQATLKQAADRLLFMASREAQGLSGLGEDEFLQLTGDGVAQFADLIVAGLVEARFHESSSGGGGFPPYQLFSVWLTEKGAQLVQGWKTGRLDDVRAALSGRKG
jgi:5-methylcytosine-specific restriction endonuclease McrA